MDKHCKDCKFHHNAGHKKPSKGMEKYNDWCLARGGPVMVGWCKVHKVKEEK